MDFIVLVLARWLPLAWAGKAFVAAILCLMSGGAAVLHRDRRAGRRLVGEAFHSAGR
jgi:hypothetical protein